MSRLFPVLFALVMFSAVTVAIIVLLKFILPDWWRRKWVRIAITITPSVGMAVSLVWYLGYVIQSRALSHSAAMTAALIFMLMVSLLFSLPLSGLIHLIMNLIGKILRRKKIQESEVSLNRRRTIQNIAAIFPATFMVSQAAGVAESFRKISLPVHKLRIENLPDELNGFKIAHLSDSHLGHYTMLDDLELVVESIKSHSPDLVVVTGDIADDLTILDSTNKIINDLKPPYGVYASIGNHEYYRGFAKVKNIFDKSPYPLLINQSVKINVNGLNVTIGGIDDPVSLKREKPEFFREVIDKTFDGVASDSFKILMSHRPRGLNYASEIGINLVLAGHTHGGQVGAFGRSLFEPMLPEIYLWGEYKKNNTTLYTSCGMGHWMPFRLGCPAEAPILILEKT